MRKIGVGLLLLFSVVYLAACGASIETEKVKAEENAEKVFNAPPEAANDDVEAIDFYLPSDMKVLEEDPNNIILDRDDHPYIFFYNQHEASNSEALYKSMIYDEDAVVVNKTFADHDRFGYLVILAVDEERFEITAGVGGFKITTEAKTKDVAAEAETLMKIATSASVAETE